MAIYLLLSMLLLRCPLFVAGKQVNLRIPLNLFGKLIRRYIIVIGSSIIVMPALCLYYFSVIQLVIIDAEFCGTPNLTFVFCHDKSAFNRCQFASTQHIFLCHLASCKCAGTRITYIGWALLTNSILIDVFLFCKIAT